MKKALAFIVCMALIISTLPLGILSVSAETQGYYTYTVADNKATITAVDKAINGDIIIPKALGGCTVTKIGSYAFKDCTGITGVTFSAEVKEVLNGAFEGCTNITKVVTDDIATWCQTYFDNPTANPLYYAKKLYLNGTEVVDLVVPESVYYIELYAFCGCESLRSITLPQNGLEGIRNGAFQNCICLEEIAFGSSVKAIYQDAFNNCPNLKKVNITDMANWCTIDFEDESANPLFGGADLYLNGTLTNDLVIPKGVTVIGDYAFYNCKSIKSVTVADGVEAVGNFAFSGCDFLEKVNLPNSLTGVSACMFENCTALKSIALPEGVKSIGGYAFEGCVSLEKITLPSSLKTIGNYAFDGCEALTGVYINDVAAWCGLEFANNKANPLRTAKNLYLYNELVTELNIPSGVSEIKKNTFNFCTSLEKVTLSDTVTRIDDFAFAYCTSLKEITLSDSLKTIGDYAFCDCAAITKINIPSSLEKVESNAFCGCYGLKGVYITNIAAWCNIEFDSFNDITTNPVATGAKLYLNNELITDLVIPEGVTKIGRIAFDGCTDIKSVDIPDTVEKIGENAFRNTAWLEGQPNGLVYAGKVAYTCKGDEPEAVVLKNDTTGIADRAFSGWYNIKNIDIPDSVKYIGKFAFSSQSKLEHIDIGDSVTEIDEYAFAWCDSLASVNMGSSLKQVGSHAFYGCGNIKKLVIPNTLESVGRGAFNGVNALEKVYYRGSLLNSYNIVIASENNSLKNAAWVYDACIFAEEHTYSGVCDTDCNLCGLIREAPDHEFGENGVCEGCGYKAYKLGDVNDDEKVDTTDLAVLKLNLAGLGELNEKGKLGADLNKDGNVDTTDLATLKLLLAGVIKL
ncbi:MAG: leucine-rich repeat protein [Clostridia bacterium]|nr:leucine-rich repeat protein [Clostridia bacterium]